MMLLTTSTRTTEREAGGNMEILKINGKSYPGKITSYKVKLIDVDGDGTGTTESGRTVRDIRLRDKAKISVKYELLTNKEFSEIMEALKADEFEVEYFDGGYKTITAYAGDRDYELIKAADEEDCRWKLETSLIEY